MFLVPHFLYHVYWFIHYVPLCVTECAHLQTRPPFVRNYTPNSVDLLAETPATSASTSSSTKKKNLAARVCGKVFVRTALALL